MSNLAITAGSKKAYIGVPNGGEMISKQSLVVTPVPVSVSPNTGSAGGTVITVNVQGVETLTTGLDIVDQAGVSICATVEIIPYNVVKCTTFAQDITN